jgi:hypothetical protein
MLFVAEVFIGRFTHDGVVRPYGGDFFIVMLLYCLVKSFFNTPVLPTAVCVLIFAYMVEISQYFHLINLLGLQHSKLARLLLGTTYSLNDMLIYTLGILVVLIVENLRLSLNKF